MSKLPGASRLTHAALGVRRRHIEQARERGNHVRTIDEQAGLAWPEVGSPEDARGTMALIVAHAVVQFAMGIDFVVAPDFGTDDDCRALREVRIRLDEVEKPTQ